MRIAITGGVASCNALSVAVALGIRRVCLASSINAIGDRFSRRPRYDYFPVDENHPTYAEDPYSLSKWLAERQADAFARRHEQMTISSLRLHALRTDEEMTAETGRDPDAGIRDLWGYTPLDDGARACLAALNAGYRGHEVLYVVAENTTSDIPSVELRDRYYPLVPIVGDLSGNRSFFEISKAHALLDRPPRRPAPAPG